MTLDLILAKNNMDEAGLLRFLDAAWGVVVAYDNFQPVVLMDACKELAKVGEAETMKQWRESQNNGAHGVDSPQ